jgi:hypothetical protein
MNVELTSGQPVEILVDPATPAAVDQVDYLFQALDILATELGTRFGDWRIQVSVGDGLQVTAAPAADLGGDGRE